MNILIANYGFPPNPGVGGRRWVKFAKYFAKSGHKVHVIHAAPAGDAVSTWEDDARLPGITRHALPRRYFFDNPHLGNNQRVPIARRIVQRVMRLWYQNTSKRRFYDQAFRWKKPFLTLANKLVSTHKIDIVIATGAPFYLLEYSAILCSQHSDLRLLCDLRDPWFGAINYGMSELAGERLESEKRIFRFICEQADWITAPNQEILDSQAESGTPIPDSKQYVLSHAFDQDDLPKPAENRSPSNDKTLRIVYGGAIYGKSQHIFESICHALDYICNTDTELYKRLRFDLYTNDRLPQQLTQRHSEQLNVTDQIGSEIHNRIRDADWTMLLAAGHYKDAMTTKFFEYGRSGNPFLVFGEEGELMKTVREHSLGVCLPFEQLQEAPESLVNTLKAGCCPDSSFFDSHGYGQRAVELLRLIEIGRKQ